MATHARISCPACQSTLRVRPEYFGMTVTCKFCDATFEASAPDAPPAALDAKGQAEADGKGGGHPDAIVRGLTARLESRERKYQAKKRLLAESEARHASLSAEIDALHARIEAAEGDALAHAKIVAELQGRIDAAEALAEELQAAREEAARLSGELAAARSDRDLLRETSEARTRELTEALAAARDERAELCREAEERDRAGADLAELHGRLEAAVTLQVEATRGRDALAEELRFARVEADRLSEELEGLKAEREQLDGMWEGRTRALTEELALVGSQAEELVSAREELALVRREAEKQGRELAEERAAAATSLADLQGRLEAAESLADTLRSDLACERDALAEEARGARADAARLSEELSEARSDRDLLQKSLEERSNELSEARALAQGHAEELSAARRAAEELGRELAEERAALAAMATQADRRVLEAHEQAQAEWARRQEMAEASRQELGGDVKAFRTDLELIRQEIAGSLGSSEATLRLIESLAEEREQVTALRDQLKSTFRSGEAVYQAKLAQASQTIQQTNQALAAERKRADELGGRLRGLEAELERQRRERETERIQSHQLILTLRQEQLAQPLVPDEVGRGPRKVTLMGKPETSPWPRVVPLVSEEESDDVLLPMDHRDLALGELGSLPAFQK